MTTAVPRLTGVKKAVIPVNDGSTVSTLGSLLAHAAVTGSMLPFEWTANAWTIIGSVTTNVSGYVLMTSELMAGLVAGDGAAGLPHPTRAALVVTTKTNRRRRRAGATKGTSLQGGLLRHEIMRIVANRAATRIAAGRWPSAPAEFLRAGTQLSQCAPKASHRPHIGTVARRGAGPEEHG